MLDTNSQDMHAEHENILNDKLFAWDKIKITAKLLLSILWRVMLLGAILGFDFALSHTEATESVNFSLKIILKQPILIFTIFALINHQVLYNVKYKSFERVFLTKNSQAPRILPYFLLYLGFLILRVIQRMLIIMLGKMFLYWLDLNLNHISTSITNVLTLGGATRIFTIIFIDLMIEHYLIHKGYWRVKFRPL